MNKFIAIFAVFVSYCGLASADTGWSREIPKAKFWASSTPAPISSGADLDIHLRADAALWQGR